MLTGREVRLIDRNGAPAGERHVLLVDPPVIEPASGARGSAVTLAQRWALPFLRAGRQTIVFGRSRVAVELLLTGLRESLRESYGPRTQVRGYRGGYLPTERRAIERGLRDGEILGVVATNALELGVDIGRLDVVDPGRLSRARSPATWQQFGRAGRRLGTSVAVLVASGRPGRPVRHPPPGVPARGHARGGPPRPGQPARPARPPAGRHVRAAVRAGRGVRAGPADDLLAFLAESGHVRQADDGRWYWASENFPASEISLRTAAPENVVIIDTTPDRPRVLGEVDLFSAQVLVHERAIYIHESVQYYVDRLEWHERKAYVHKIDVDHYTYANRAVTLKPLEVFAEAPATGGRRIHGEVMVASLVTLFKKLKFLTDENVGWGPIDLPELELQTTAYWLTADAARERWRRDELDVALLGAGRAIQTVAAVLLMVDPRDLGLVTQVRSPHAEEPTIYLYEAVPGGIGLSERLWERHDELVAGAADAHRGVRVRRGLPGLHRPAARARRRRQGPRPAPAARARGRRGDAPRPEPRRRSRDDRRRSPGSDWPGGSSGSVPRCRRRPRPRRRPTRPLPPRGRARRPSSAERLAAAVGRRGRHDADGPLVRVRGAARPTSRSTGRGSRLCPASRRRTRRCSASTPRRPAWPRPPGRSPSSSASAGGRATVPPGPAPPARPRARSRRCSTRSRRTSRPTPGW